MRPASPDLVLCCTSPLSHACFVVVRRAQIATEDTSSSCMASFKASFHHVRDLDCTSLGQNPSSTFQILCKIYVATGLGLFFDAGDPTGPSAFDGTTGRKAPSFRRYRELRLTCSRTITSNLNKRNVYDWFINTWASSRILG